MISNLSLVVHLALSLGVPASTIEACLEGWRPYHHRGETYSSGELTYYVDCYNANPGSMLDSASRFQRLFANQPQLYVLGSMNELGEASEQWHRETGLRINLPKHATACLMGEGKAWLREGLLAAGFPESAIFLVENLEAVRERLETFQGAVFLKASRSYRLEQLLPEEAERC